jgi:hypothetical protein
VTTTDSGTQTDDLLSLGAAPGRAAVTGVMLCAGKVVT